MYFFNDLPRFGGGGGLPSINDIKASQFNVHIATVIDIDDTNDSGRICAIIKGKDDSAKHRLDNARTKEEIASIKNEIYALPLLPKYLNVFPKKNEIVFIFIQDDNKPYGERFWVGPIISQPQYLRIDDTVKNKSNLKYGGVAAPSPAPSTIPEANGVYPRKNEIAFQGRDNADLIFRSGEAILRAGKYKNEIPKETNIPVFNPKQAYFKLANNVSVKKNSDNSTTKGSVATMVADKLLLLTYDGRQNHFDEYKLTDGSNKDPNIGYEITEKTLLEVLEKAEPAVYGNVLVSFMKLIKEFASNHTHPYSGLPPVRDKFVLNVLEYDLNSLLAKNIRLV
jgi:hypothetical protein